MCLACWLALPAAAADVTVRVTGLETSGGQVGCALYDSAAAFLDPSKAAAAMIGRPAERAATCSFSDLTPGTYAVAVFHDLNGNGVTDTNFLGLPKEPWGISVHSEPLFRAPRFDDAAFELGASDLSLTLELR